MCSQAIVVITEISCSYYFHILTGKLSKASESVCKKVGIHLHASRGPSEVSNPGALNCISI